MRKQIEKNGEGPKAAAAEEKEKKSGTRHRLDVRDHVDVKKTGQQKVLSGETCNETVDNLDAAEGGKTLEQGRRVGLMTADNVVRAEEPAMRRSSSSCSVSPETVSAPTWGTYARDLASAWRCTRAGRGDGAPAKESAQMDGTAWLTTVTFESVATAEQAQARAETGQGRRARLGGIAGGLGDVRPEEEGDRSGRKKRDSRVRTENPVDDHDHRQRGAGHRARPSRPRPWRFGGIQTEVGRRVTPT